LTEERFETNYGLTAGEVYEMQATLQVSRPFVGYSIDSPGSMMATVQGLLMMRTESGVRGEEWWARGMDGGVKERLA